MPVLAMTAIPAQAAMDVNWEQMGVLLAVIIALMAGQFAVMHWMLGSPADRYKDMVDSNKELAKLLERSNEEQTRMRHDLRSEVLQKFGIMDDRFKDESDRIKALEIFQSGMVIMLEQMKEFRDEMKDKLDRLMSDRQRDMNNIHRRLDALLNKQITANNRAAMGMDDVDHGG